MNKQRETGDLFPAENEVLRRPNQTISITPTNGKITAVMRRSFVVMLAFSQKDGHQETYRRPLSELARVSGYTSRSTGELKDHLRSLQAIQVEWNNSNGAANQWTVSGLIAEVSLIETKGQPTIVEWVLLPRVRAELLNPVSYTSLALKIYTSLRSGASLALYEICSRYKTNPTRVTNRAEWEWWLPRITGNPDSDMPEYKYFKRDVLKPAIKEINAMSDIEIELLEFRHGKYIKEIQFRVRHQDNLLLEREAVEDVDGDLLEQVIRLGFKEPTARKYCQEYDADLLRKTIILVEQRAANKNLPELKSKPALFRKAVKDRYADVNVAEPAKRPVEATESPQAKQERLMNILQVQRAKEAYNLFLEVDDAERQEIRDKFLQTTSAVPFLKSGSKSSDMRSTPFRTAFSLWYAELLWQAPTQQDLIEFMIKNPNLL